ncbi:MAG TPA: GGDEF domain-containing protein, partial [Mesorhizobium sp.]
MISAGLPPKSVPGELFRADTGIFAWFSAPWKDEPQAVRAKLLASTFDRKFAVVFGSASVLILAGSALVFTHAWWPWAWIAADLILLVIRFHLMVECERGRRVAAHSPLAQLMAAGALWSVTFGLGCYICAASGHMALTVLAGLNVAGVLGVATSRNAATPRYAIFVMLAVSFPYVVGALLSREPGMAVVGIQMPVYIVGIVIVMLRNHAIAVRMIRAEIDNRELAVKEALTGLPNRIFLQEKLRAMCEELAAPAANGGRPFAVLSMDLDGFKQVNDSFGHGVGDNLLRKVAKILTQTFREQDTICRIGGDEFVILLPNTSEIEATYLAKRSIDDISEPFDLGVATSVRIGLSIGSAFA